MLVFSFFQICKTYDRDPFCLLLSFLVSCGCIDICCISSRYEFKAMLMHRCFSMMLVSHEFESVIWSRDIIFKKSWYRLCVNIVSYFSTHPQDIVLSTDQIKGRNGKWDTLSTHCQTKTHTYTHSIIQILESCWMLSATGWNISSSSSLE